MELLRRALLIGCLVPALWLFRLAPLDPLVSITRIDFGARQARERAALDASATEAQRRQASLPLPVYIEELLQYNVFSAAGPAWESFLSAVDDRTRNESEAVFLRADAEPMMALADRLAAAGGTTFISLSRPGGDVHYQVDRRLWTRRDFGPWSGFHGPSRPPAPLLYPFRGLATAGVVAGVVFFVLLSWSAGSGRATRITAIEAALLGAGLLSFALPLAIVGGSVQALTRAPLITAACWLGSFAAMHQFAAPARYAPNPLTAPSGAGASESRPADRALFVREGLVFLLIAFGPTAFVVSGSLVLWNR